MIAARGYTPQGPVAQAIKPCRGALVSTAAMSCTINILTLTGPIFMLQISDRVLSSQSVPTLVVIGLVALAFYFFFGVLDYVRMRVVGRIGLSIDAHLSGAVFEMCALLPVKMGKDDQTLNPMRDLETVRQFISGPGPSALFDLPWMPFYMLIVWMFHPTLGVVAVIGAAWIVFLVTCNECVSSRPMVRLSARVGQRHRFLEGCRQSAEAIQSMGMVGHLRGMWAKNNHDYLLEHRRSADLANLFGSMIKVARFVLQSAILGTGAWLVIEGEVTAGVMIASSIIASRALAPIEQVISCWRGLTHARGALKRLNAFGGGWSETAVETELPEPCKRLSVDFLFAAPAPDVRPVIKGVGFEVLAGRALGILGPSGSGKTTLARAILGVTPAAAGQVKFDGAALAHWDRSKIGDFVGYLPQRVQLLDGSVAQNICRFNPDRDDEKIIEAATLAGIHDFVASLERGYDTLVGEGGRLMSGGQRQRVGLARAIYSCPFIVILDEPNSNLDSDGDVALTGVIEHLKAQGCIVLVIAHHMSALAAVDDVLVLEGGKVKARGPRSEILGRLVKPVTASGARNV